MQAQGNDFVILDGLHQPLPPIDASFVRKICDRHLGIGCDQLLVLEEHNNADVLMLIYNADGSQAANCGNGLRCVAEHLMLYSMKNIVSIALSDRIIQAKRTEHGVQVNMGIAEIEQTSPQFTDVNIGNLHRVYFEGEALCLDRNVEIVSSWNNRDVNIRIIERGSGETLACGSGACATAMAVWDKSGCDDEITVHMPGGDVIVSILNDELYLEGEVNIVFSGEYF